MRGVLDGNTPEQSHEGWLAEKAATGWKHGPEKDPEKKEHPCFVPYAKLPPAQQKKDLLFVSTVRVVAAALGMKVKYPACPAQEARDGLPAMPAFPERTIDYSQNNTSIAEPSFPFPLPADRMLKWFAYAHLPEHLQDISKRFAELVKFVVENVESGPERTVALRKLLEAKDAAVRAKLFPGG